MSLTLTLPLDVPVRPMDAKGLTISAPSRFSVEKKKKKNLEIL